MSGAGSGPDWSTLRQRLGRGETLQQIGASLGVTKQAVCRQAQKQGIRSRVVLQTEWTEAEIAVLREGWDAGDSTRAITARLPDRNRNMVIGKAHRLGLPGRPSPIRRNKKPCAFGPLSTVRA